MNSIGLDLESPEQLSEQICWRDMSRPCDGDCVAFDRQALENAKYTPCRLINLRRLLIARVGKLGEQFERHNDLLERQLNQNAKRDLGQTLQNLDPGPPEVT